jgi:hypothetical protein
MAFALIGLSYKPDLLIMSGSIEFDRDTVMAGAPSRRWTIGIPMPFYIHAIIHFVY